MFEPPGLRRDAASTIFNLTDYRVIAALDLPHAGRVLLSSRLGRSLEESRGDRHFVYDTLTDEGRGCAAPAG